MSTPRLDEFTQLLKAWAGGDERALDRLTPFVYPQERNTRQFRAGIQATWQPRHRGVFCWYDSLTYPQT